MPENPYTVVLKDIGGKKQVELSRFDLDKNYHILALNIIRYLMDSGYDVSKTDMKKLNDWEKHSYHEISFRSKKKAGLLKNKIEYGKMHTLWIGHKEGRVTLKEVVLKLDGNNYLPNPALQAIYRIVGNKE
jgi:hypothetical protein